MRGQTPTPKGTQVFIGTEAHGPHPATRPPAQRLPPAQLHQAPALSPCLCSPQGSLVSGGFLWMADSMVSPPQL